MNQMLGYEKLYYAIGLIARGIPEEPDALIAPDVADTLQRARAHMLGIPDVLENLETALQEFMVLDRAIDRLIGLAQTSIRLPEDDLESRESLETEFIRFSQAVASVAGRMNYQGPDLSVSTKPQAGAAYLALKNLIPVKETLRTRLHDQEANIMLAVRETVNFLEVVAEAYPEAASLQNIPDLLQRVMWVRESSRPVNMTGYGGTVGIH